jgi:hypothetical protein
MGNVQANVVEKIKTQILCSKTLFGNLVFYETVWKNMAKPR